MAATATASPNSPVRKSRATGSLTRAGERALRHVYHGTLCLQVADKNATGPLDLLVERASDLRFYL